MRQTRYLRMVAAAALLSLGICTQATGQTDVIQNGGFESGWDGWAHSGGPTLGSGSFARTGNYFLWLGGDSSTDTAYQTIRIASTAIAANLSFYYNINSSEPTSGKYDTFSVTVRDASGNILAAVGDWSNLDGTQPGKTYYHQATFNLLPYAGTTIGIYFVSNCRLVGSQTTNFRVDDVSVLVTSGPTANVPTVETLHAASVTPNSAVLSGRVIDNGGAAITDRRFEWAKATSNWGTGTEGVDWGLVYNTRIQGPDSGFSATLSGLQAGAGYKYRVYAWNSAGPSSASAVNVETFTTSSGQQPPSFTSQPANQSVPAGQNANFTVAATGNPAPNYDWQRSTDGGANWSNLSNDTTYSGVTTSTLLLSSVTAAMNGYQFRAVARNGANPDATSSSATLTVSSSNQRLVGKKIGVDPGHGGSDSGAPGPTGLTEKSLNLSTALALKKYLEADGATVLNTRTSDPAPGTTLSLSARSDLFINNAVNLAISVHHNYVGDPSVNTTMGFIYCYSSLETGGRLASNIVRRLAAATGIPVSPNPAGYCVASDPSECEACNGDPVRPDWLTGLNGVGQANMHMVREPVTKGGIPSVLAEISFISNPVEEQKLRNPDYLDANGWAIYAGLADYYGFTPIPRGITRPTLTVSSVTPTSALTKDWGESVVYTVTVADANGSPVAGALVGGDDDLRLVSFTTAPNTTDANGQITYTTSVPNGKLDGTYNISFVATKSGYNNSGATSRQVEVEHSLQVSRISGSASRPGYAPSSVFIQRYPVSANAPIDPNLRTWVVIHGRTDSSTSSWVSGSSGLAAAIAGIYPNDQVLLLDWTQAASDTDPFTLPTEAEDWIKPVAAWAAGKLVDYGFSGSNMNLIGHSWGGYVAAEMAELIPYTRSRPANFVGSIVALDPAENGAGDYDPENLTADNGTRDVNFARNSAFSWAFHSSNFGSEQTPTTAHEAFRVIDNSGDAAKQHSDITWLFSYFVRHSSGISASFQLDRLLSRQYGPWLPNQFDSLGIQNGVLGYPGYEAVVFTADGQSPDSIQYVPAIGSFTATHSSDGYAPGGTITVSCTLSYSGQPSALGWSAVIPSGWTYQSGQNEPGLHPDVGDTGKLGWAWSTIPASPVQFAYTIKVPPGESGAKSLRETASKLEGGQQQTATATPDPLVVNPQLLYHSADTDHDWSISLLELMRVIELYNYRSGTTRTGDYHVQSGTEDGYGLGPGDQSGQWHSADWAHDWKLDLLELMRVIELYNYRSGTARTGQYHVQPGTDDGFGLGPAASGQRTFPQLPGAALARLTRCSATGKATQAFTSLNGNGLTVQCQLTYTGSPCTLGWQATIPDGLAYVSGTASSDLKPEAGSTGTLGWAWINPPPSPVRFSYTLRALGEPPGRGMVTGEALYREGGQSSEFLAPALGVGASSGPSMVDASIMGRTFTVSISTEIGRNYTLEFVDSVPGQIWAPLQTVTGTGGTVTFTDDAATNDSRYYRIHIQ